MIDMDWAKLQVMTTIDYAHGSWLTTFLSGALNHQVVHHLFPNISQVQSPLLSSCLFFSSSADQSGSHRRTIPRSRPSCGRRARSTRCPTWSCPRSGWPSRPTSTTSWSWVALPTSTEQGDARPGLPSLSSFFQFRTKEKSEEGAETFQFSRTVSKPRLRFVPRQQKRGS